MQITGDQQMMRIVRHNDESVREGYIRNSGKEVKLFTSALKAFQCNHRIVMTQRKHLDDFLRGRIIGRLECGRTQLGVSEELGIAQSVISRLWQRFQDDGNKQTEHSIRPVSSATSTTVSRQTVYRRLGHIGLYARRPVRCVQLTATHCRLRLTWSREHALWTPQQWSCVMFSDESRFSLQSDSRWTLIWRAPGTRYHRENTIERHRFGGAGWLVWGGIILGSRTDLHVQSVTMTGHIYRDVILEQHVRLFRGAMGAEFLFMDDNTRSHNANIIDECLQSEDITRMDWPAYSPDLNPIEHVWDMLCRRIATRQSPPTCLRKLQRALLDEWCNIPQDQMDNLILSMPRRLPFRFRQLSQADDILRIYILKGNSETNEGQNTRDLKPVVLKVGYNDLQRVQEKKLSVRAIRGLFDETVEHDFQDFHIIASDASKIDQITSIAATRGLLATDHVFLNHGQVTWTTPELAPPLLTTTPHQREDVSALDIFNVHRCPTRWVFSGTGLQLLTRQATVRYLYHSATTVIAFVA
ncbi:transposable element Tcb1 transposase [Trichonephila clavipes]|nr:transposable element Tcb1 transposase [Trichonephila clavipes]